MIEAVVRLAGVVEHARYTGQCLDGSPCAEKVVRVADVDVGDLVIGQSECTRPGNVEVLPSQLVANREQARLAQRAIDVNGTRNRDDAASEWMITLRPVIRASSRSSPTTASISERCAEIPG